MNDGGIPLATDGFATYHPPLFYAASGALASIGQGFGLAREIGLKGLPFLSGFALVVLAWALALRLVPGEASVRRLALLFAALLPMNIYIAAYFTNEGFHAALAAAALVWAVDILLREDFSLGRIAIFSVLVGLAVLTKFSGFLIAVPAGAALALRMCVDERSGRSGRLVGLLALVVPALAMAGWFYARNISAFGDPLMGNWNFSEPGKVWWSEPGFHTSAYYLSFGASLTQPFLSSYQSFWDSLYSTFWGDGLLAGQGGIATRHALWNYSLMAAGYVLAVPATLLMFVGFVRGLGFAINDFEQRRRAVFALLAVVSLLCGFAVFWLTLSLPYFGQAKAFYALMLTPAWRFTLPLASRRLSACSAALGVSAAGHPLRLARDLLRLRISLVLDLKRARPPAGFRRDPKIDLAGGHEGAEARIHVEVDAIHVHRGVAAQEAQHLGDVERGGDGSAHCSTVQSITLSVMVFLKSGISGVSMGAGHTLLVRTPWALVCFALIMV